MTASMKRRRPGPFTTALASAVVLFLCLATTPTIVRAEAAARAPSAENHNKHNPDPAQLIVPSGHDTPLDKADELFGRLQEKVVALETAEKTIKSLEAQLASATKEQEAKVSDLFAAEKQTRALAEQVKELKAQVKQAEDNASAAIAAAASGPDPVKLAAQLESAQAALAAAQIEASEAKKEVARLGKKVSELEAALSQGNAAGNAWEEERQALQGQVERLTEETKKARSLAKAKEEAQAKISVLETEVANAGRKAAAARSELEKQLKQKDKEIVEMQHVLQDTLDNKYSLAVLSADLATFSKGVGWTVKEKSVKGFHWTVEQGKKHGAQAQVALKPHLETAVEKLGELHREASKVCLPLVDEHVTPHYEAHVKPRVEQTLAAVEPVWREEVRPRVLQGVKVGKGYAKRGWKVVKAKASKAREKAVAWVNQQEWADKNGEGIVTAGIYILVATLLFLLRFSIWAAVKGVTGLVWWVVRLPFVVVYWCIFWPTLLFGWGKKSQTLDSPLGQRGGAGSSGGRREMGRNGSAAYTMPLNPNGPPPTHPLAQPQYGR